MNAIDLQDILERKVSEIEKIIDVTLKERSIPSVQLRLKIHSFRLATTGIVQEDLKEAH